VTRVQSYYLMNVVIQYHRHGNETQHDLEILQREYLLNKTFRTLGISAKRMKGIRILM
jgi:hypothetical protein